jgi:hypothetical protein
MRLKTGLLFSRVGIVILIAILGSATFLDAEIFTNPRFLQTGSNPIALAQGDLNGDGAPDLIYADGGSSPMLHVLLGNGDGAFQHGQDIPLPAGGGLLAVDDLNGDGKLDLIMGVGGPQPQVGVMLGNGNGTFQSPVLTPLPANASTYAFLAGCGVADFNGDGANDLIVTDELDNSLYVLLGNTTGAFTVKSTVQQFSGPTTVFVADFNGDGHQDFLVFDRLSADVAVFLGNGDGSFRSPVRYTGLGQIWSALLADTDGDGHPDLVVTGPGNVLAIYRGNADGTFAATSSGGSSNAGPILRLMVAADFNGDGMLDLAAVGNNGITILVGKGNLTYAPPMAYGAGPSTSQAVMADFNRDGHADFALVAPGGIALLLGNADGSLQTFGTYDVGAPATAVAVADFNGDHLPDIAVNIGTLNPLIMLGQGGGEFGYTRGTPPASPNGASQLLTGDFNGDGKVDLLFAAGNSVPDTVLYGNGDGTFTPASISGYSNTLYGLASVADINNDGTTDFVQLGYESLSILLGHRNNSFTISTFLSAGYGTAAPAFGDFNHDGKLDMVIGGITTMQILLGNGNGAFQMGRTLQTEIAGYTNLNEPMVICTGDFDGDGNTDIVALISYPAVIEIWYGKGDGTFEDPSLLWLSRGYSQMASADLNGDGKPDLVLSDGNVIAVIHNNGHRNFGPEVYYLAGTVGSLVIEDVNGDGAPDIVVANGQYATSVSVLLNQPGGLPVSGTLTVSPEPSTYGQPYTITVAIQPLDAGSGIPTGTVRFSDDNGLLGAATLTNGTTSFTDNSSPAVGTYTILADYSGDSTFSPGTLMVQHAVVPIIYPTTTTLVAAPNPVLAGQTVSFTATVASTGPQPPGRWVAFYDANTTIGTVWLGTSNTAVFDTALLSPGTHNVTAAYLGDVNFAPSTSAPVAEVVTAHSTSTALSALPGTVHVGAPVSLTAVVTSASGKPTGAVVFWDGTTAFAAQPLDATGAAVYIATFSTVGTHSLVAVYQRNGSYASSTSGVLNVVVSSSNSSNSSHTVLTASLGPGGAASLSLRVIVTAPSGTPTGGVVFYEGTSQMGEATLGPTGVAVLTTPAPGPGTHYLTAYYRGNARFAPSVASVLLGDASSEQPDFALAAAPISRSVLRGQSTTVSVAVIPSHGFSGDVVLSCATGTPSLSCSLAPSTVHNGSGASTLTITAYQARGALMPVRARPAPWQEIFLAAMVLGLLGLFVPRRARCRYAFLVLTLVCFGVGVGCRGQSMLSLTPPGTYLVTVTASSVQAGGQISHVVYVQIIVAVR